MVVGFLWYGPLFGRQWIRMMNFTQQDMERAKAKGMGKTYLLSFIGALVTAYVLHHLIVFASAFTGAEGASAGIMAAFWAWLGFVATVTLNNVLWEGRSWKMWLLTNGHQLVSLIVMGWIMASWM